MKLQAVEKRSGLSPEEFQMEYLEPLKPVVFTDLVKDWPATEKWTFKWLKENYGHLQVPLYGNDFHEAGKNYMASKLKMRFDDYLDLIQREPTELRMFLYNIFDHAPELVNDFSMPDITTGWHKNFPYMFFGGKGSFVNLHYDIDCSNVFLTQFQTRKRVVLFPPSQSRNLYQEPFTVKSRLDIANPDYEQYPAFINAEGYETVLEHGETLFMPSCYWHYIEYLEGGFGLSLRTHNSVGQKVRGLSNLARHFFVDKGMNRLLGERWNSWKQEKAKERAMAGLKAVS